MDGTDLRAEAAKLFSRAETARTRRAREKLMLRAVSLLGEAEGREQADRLARKRAAALR
jgi:hypothetical protein